MDNYNGNSILSNGGGFIQFIKADGSHTLFMIGHKDDLANSD